MSEGTIKQRHEWVRGLMATSAVNKRPTIVTTDPMPSMATEKMKMAADIEHTQVVCVVVGAAGVGKSTFVDKLSGGSVRPDYSMTSRVTFRKKSYLQANSRNQVEAVYLDCPGLELYNTLVQDLSKKLPPKSIVVAVFDVTNRASIAALDGALSWIGKSGTKSADQSGVLVANKMDLVDKRIVSSSEGQQKAKMLKMRYFECSALNDLTAPEFDLLVADLATSGEADRNGPALAVRPVEPNL